MGARTFFNTGKKRDLSDDSKEQGEDDPKKTKESSASQVAMSITEVCYQMG